MCYSEMSVNYGIKPVVLKLVFIPLDVHVNLSKKNLYWIGYRCVSYAMK